MNSDARPEYIHSTSKTSGICAIREMPTRGEALGEEAEDCSASQNR
jgi:hypothetical protein